MKALSLTKINIEKKRVILQPTCMWKNNYFNHASSTENDVVEYCGI